MKEIDEDMKKSLCYRIFHALWNTNETTTLQIKEETKTTAVQIQIYLNHFREVMGKELVNYKVPTGTRKYIWHMETEGRSCEEMFRLFLEKKTTLQRQGVRKPKKEKSPVQEEKASTAEMPEQDKTFVPPLGTLLEAKSFLPENIRVIVEGKVEVAVTVTIKMG